MILKTYRLMDEVDDRGDSVGDAGGGAASDVDEQADILAAASQGDDAAETERLAAEAKAAEKDKTIPKARFDEAVKKEREARAAAEGKLKELEAQLRSQESALDEEKVEGEIAELEAAIDAAAADGDKAKVAALRKEVRGKMMAIASAEATRRAAYATAVAVERVQYDATVTMLEGQHPTMNPEHDDYDQDLTNELLELKAAYEATGMGSTDALKKAAKYVFKTAVAEAKKDEPDEATKKAAAEAKVKATEAAIRKGLETKGKQPPASGGRAAKEGAGAALDPTKMSDRDFDKLPADEKARLRGDAG
jgi:hypothetical protein